jgi:hypothetical protein
MISHAIRLCILRCSLALATAVGCVNLHAPSAEAQPVLALGVPSYHVSTDELRIPVTGSGTPKILLQQLAARQFVVELMGCEIPLPAHGNEKAQASSLAGWSLSHDAGRARLRLTLREDASPRVQFDAKRREIVLSFPPGKPTGTSVAGWNRGDLIKPVEAVAARNAEVTPEAAAAQRVRTRPPSATPLVLRKAKNAAPRLPKPHTLTRHLKSPQKASNARSATRTTLSHFSANRTVVGTPRFDRAHGHLVIPVVRGSLRSTTIKTYRLNKRWSYLDIEGALPSFSGVAYQERPDFKFQRWVSARRPQRAATRVSFASGVAVRLDVQKTSQAVLVRVVPIAATTGHRATPQQVKAPSATISALRTFAKPLVKLDTTVSRPYYDAERFGLVLPYEGRLPLYRYIRKSPRSAVIELKAAARHDSHLEPKPVVNNTWGNWKLTRRRGNPYLSLELNFTQPSEVSIAADPERKHLVLIPHPQATKSHTGTRPVEAHSYLSPLVVDQREENLFIPYAGAVPRYVIERISPTHVCMVFRAASLREAGVQLHTTASGSPLKYALFTQPENSNSVNLAVALSVPAAVHVFQDEAQSRLIVRLNRQAEGSPIEDQPEPSLPTPWADTSAPDAEPTEPSLESHHVPDVPTRKGDVSPAL